MLNPNPFKACRVRVELASRVGNCHPYVHITMIEHRSSSFSTLVLIRERTVEGLKVGRSKDSQALFE